MSEFAGEFGKSFIKMVWTDDGLHKNLRDGPKKVMREVEALMTYMAPEIENWMKMNASWQDQTGNARNGLAARPFKDGDGLGIVLYHQVPYGIWLEVRFSGTYGIIVPAMEEWGPKVMERAEGIMERLGR